MDIGLSGEVLPFDEGDAADLLKVMGHPARFKVLCLVQDRERDVRSLAKAVNLSQSALSQHLKILRDANLVSARRQAQTVFYRSHEEGVRQVLDCMQSIFCPVAETHEAVAVAYA
ncbi:MULTISPECIES: metalloregulator ArsR/SmtB family transcription factor [unclassified Rhizobium]|uniref:ArsR/SmtB family transcription factor n=1 Tax=Rhizobium/Agrobacterium group TaxID=227290 RepID=UPI0008A7B809|nr:MULTISPECIES: metalloregulator ArsR/SmtB family transcription factor [unclassified Rhizobium]MBP2459932.1 DNA-binding transcriptional ArsR family regulator [Rhizobium sp. PvP014]MBP2531292.1 DNA-binding transcriptional ArsR family regulator [Rhizobium sp. PvP099]SEH26593.1 DNA-binding transcriptional regulator, ArsR family [Rhizobium sp. NFR12]